MKKKEYKNLKKYEMIYYKGFSSLPFYVVDKLKGNKIKATIKNGGIVLELSYKDFERGTKYNVEIKK
jgi:hypothetical protein